MKKNLNVDVMVGEKFYKTVHIKIDTTMQFVGDQIKDVVDFEDVNAKVLAQCPSLTNRNYRILL